MTTVRNTLAAISVPVLIGQALVEPASWTAVLGIAALASASEHRLPAR